MISVRPAGQPDGQMAGWVIVQRGRNVNIAISLDNLVYMCLVSNFA